MSKNKKRVFIKKDNPAIQRIDKKCIMCGACRNICEYVQGVYGYNKKDKKNLCIMCGQCVMICPTDALETKCHYKAVLEKIKDKHKTVVFQVAPAVRVSIGDEFNLAAGTDLEKKMPSLLKALGADYVFDTTFGADLTVLEEAKEFLGRLESNEKLPLLTSCCTSWMEFINLFYPQYLKNITKVKSPIQIEGAVIKSYWAEKMHIDKKDIVVVAITPCTAKKYEITWTPDVDYVLTTKELGTWARNAKIDINTLDDASFDSFMDKGSGAGLIFGSTGGVVEAILRTAHYFYTGKEAPKEFFDLSKLRGLEDIRELEVVMGKRKIKIAIVHGMMNGRKFLDRIKKENLHYDIVEVMACRGGCIGGGGQPKKYHQSEIKNTRAETLFKNDKENKIHASYENKKVLQLYEEYFESIGSKKVKDLLHYKIDEIRNGR